MPLDQFGNEQPLTRTQEIGYACCWALFFIAMLGPMVYYCVRG